MRDCPIGKYSLPDQDCVVFGKPFADAARDELSRLGAKRAFLITTRSLMQDWQPARDLVAALGDRLVGVFPDCVAHTPQASVMAASQAVRESNADLIVALGGGSVIDTAKASQACLWKGLTDAASFETFCATGFVASNNQLPPLRILAIPTTLSGAEFTSLASTTGPDGKELLQHRSLIPRVVVLDPAALEKTSLPFLLSTGFKAIDHAVETYCSPACNAASGITALGALTLTVDALRELKKDRHQQHFGLNAQLGTWMSLAGLHAGISYGLSHALGYVLGAQYAVPHGLTSCVTLPAVLRWNRLVNGSRQRRISHALGQPDMPPADILDNLLITLELPTRLSQVGIEEKYLVDICERTLRHPFARQNPRPINSEADLLPLLQSCL